MKKAYIRTILLTAIALAFVYANMPIIGLAISFSYFAYVVITS